MAFIPAMNVAAVEIRWRQDQQRVENTLYFHRETGWDDISLYSLLVDIRTQVRTAWLPLMAEGVSLHELHARDLTVEASYVADLSGEFGDNGGITQAYLPNNVTLSITFRTGFSGRSFRGRNYIVGMYRDAVSLNAVSQLYADAWAAAYEGFLQVADGHNATWVVLSRYANNAPRETGVYTPIRSTGFADLIVDSLRRRLPGRGL